MTPDEWENTVLDRVLDQALLDVFYFPRQSKLERIRSFIFLHISTENVHKIPYFTFLFISFLFTGYILKTLCPDIGISWKNFINGCITYFMPVF